MLILTIGYLPGKANVVADALSRAVYNAMPRVPTAAQSPDSAEAGAAADAAGLAAAAVVAGDQGFLASLRSALASDELA